MLKSGKRNTKNTAKTYLQKSHARKSGPIGPTPCGPLKEGSQDWQPNQGIRNTPLVLTGTLADNEANQIRVVGTIEIGKLARSIEIH